MGKNMLTAEEAKALSSEPKSFVNALFRSIKDCATFGGTKTIFTGENMTKEAQSYVIDTLHNLGYSVDVFTEEVDAVKNTDVLYKVQTFVVTW